MLKHNANITITVDAGVWVGEFFEFICGSQVSRTRSVKQGPVNPQLKGEIGNHVSQSLSNHL